MNFATMTAVAMLVLAAPAEAANFSGKWVGKAIATSATDRFECLVTLTVTQTDTTYSQTFRFTRDGGHGRFNLDTTTFTIRGHDLLLEGELAGSISDTDVSTMVDDGWTIQSRSIDDATLSLTVAVADPGGPPILSIKGELRR
jgi:hypothetical protein